MHRCAAIGLLVAGCTATPVPAPPPVASAPRMTPTAPSPPAAKDAPMLTLEELRNEEANLLEYPPTACRVRQLVGDRLPALKERGGYYPVGDLPDAVAYQGAVCPQPYCDRGLTWIRPDGAMVVAIEDGEETALFTNRQPLTDDPPAVVQAFLTEGARFVEREVTWTVNPTGDCDDVSSATAAYRAAKDKRACDPTFSHFWTWGAVVPKAGDAAPFHRGPDAKRGTFAPRGSLVALGYPHATDVAYVCAELRQDGRRTVGYLHARDLRPLDERRVEPSETAAAGQAPTWLTAAPTRLDDLTVQLDGASPGGIEIDLQRTVSGHICEARGTLEPRAPRLFTDGTVGCDVEALVLNNGVYLWENGDCSGARATCAGGYW